MRIRTIDKGYEEFKTVIDPNTCVSRHDWRQIIITRQLKSVRRSGTRYLYDLDEMVDYLKNPTADEPPEASKYGQLRRIGG